MKKPLIVVSIILGIIITNYVYTSSSKPEYKMSPLFNQSLKMSINNANAIEHNNNKQFNMKPILTSVVSCPNTLFYECTEWQSNCQTTDAFCTTAENTYCTQQSNPCQTTIDYNCQTTEAHCSYTTEISCWTSGPQCSTQGLTQCGTTCTGTQCPTSSGSTCSSVCPTVAQTCQNCTTAETAHCTRDTLCVVNKKYKIGEDW